MGCNTTVVRRRISFQTCIRYSRRVREETRTRRKEASEDGEERVGMYNNRRLVLKNALKKKKNINIDGRQATFHSSIVLTSVHENDNGEEA